MSQPSQYDHELEVAALSFAARLLFSDLDHDLMIQRGLESLADLARSPRVGLFLLDAKGHRIEEEAGLLNGEVVTLPPLGEPLPPELLEVMTAKRPAVFKLSHHQGLPWPVGAGGEPGMECLCAPLVAADNKVIGFATMEHRQGEAPDRSQAQPLIIFLAVMALALEVTRLLHLAVTDGLTGLYVRRFFDIRLEEELARLERYGGRLSLMMVDLDHFKRLNDGYGHQTGDKVLKEAARLMRDTVRKRVDVVCRYGGEEFVLILPNTDAAGAMGLAARMQKAFREHSFQSVDGTELAVTFSAGVSATDNENPVPPEELFRRADQALYAAKAAGRDQALPWGPGLPGGAAR